MIFTRHSFFNDIDPKTVRPDLDYGDVLYDKRFNESFHRKLESVEQSAALAMTGELEKTNTETLYQELGLESLQIRRKVMLNLQNIQISYSTLSS